MKKKILGGIVVLTIAAVAAFNINLNTQGNGLPDISLDNVEALASESSEDFTGATGCIAVWENVKCKGKSGNTYTYAKKN